MPLSLRRVLRFRLSTLLCLFVCFGLGFGWWKDHTKQDERLREAELIHEMMLRAGRSGPHGVFQSRAEFEHIHGLLFSHIRRAAGEVPLESGKPPVATLAQFLDEKDVKVRLATVYRHRHWAEPVQLLQKALDDVDADVRMLAICGLLFDRDRDASTTARAITAARAEMQKTVSPQAVYAAYLAAVFAGCVEEPGERPLEPIRRLVELLEQGDVKTRYWAITALLLVEGAMDADIVLPVLIESASDPDWAVRRLAVQAIGELADPQSARREFARRVLLQAYQAAEDDEIRTAAAGALSRLEVRGAISP